MNAAPDKNRDDQEQRIMKLEELAAHQARTIDELSAELANQWTLVNQLQKKLDRLAERFSTLEEASLEAPAITRPPHY
jgi:SlyX protein